ncbi:pentapeptide repeat-containing protein [Aeromonas veronii]
MALVNHIKIKIKNKEFNEDESNNSYSQKIFERVFAVQKTFTDINFSQTDFSDCYFRNCKFIRCNFTGASFKNCYLMGSNFPKCIFKYTTFSSTHLDDKFLDSYLPPEENLARDLVRTLRVNFSQVGNYEGVNKAARLEVKLTGIHLFKAAHSKESYYRAKEKYSGINRMRYLFAHIKWKFLDLLWGNGESITRVIISSAIFIFLISLLVYNLYTISFNVAFSSTFYQFWGVAPDYTLSKYISMLLTVGRLVLFSLFISILIKKLSKR